MKTTYHKTISSHDFLEDAHHDDGAAVSHVDDRRTDEPAAPLCSGKGISTADCGDESSSELVENIED